MDLLLIIDTARNLVLNPDGVTILRTIYLTKGTTYNVKLAFYSNGVPVSTPSISQFQFFADFNNSTVLESIILNDTGDANYPKGFSLYADSTELNNAIGSDDSLELAGEFSWANGTDTTVIAPFTILVKNSIAATPPAYYPLNSNPAHYLTSSDVAGFATTTALEAETSAREADIAGIGWDTLSGKPDTLTLQGNTFNGASQLVQLDENGFLPPVDGSNLVGDATGFAAGYAGEAGYADNANHANYADSAPSTNPFDQDLNTGNDVSFATVRTYQVLGTDGPIYLGGGSVYSDGLNFHADYFYGDGSNLTNVFDQQLNTINAPTFANGAIVFNMDGSATFNGLFYIDTNGGFGNSFSYFSDGGDLSVGNNFYVTQSNGDLSIGTLNNDPDNYYFRQGNIYLNGTISTYMPEPVATADGIAGQMFFTDNYIYRCFGAGDWRRAAITFATY